MTSTALELIPDALRAFAVLRLRMDLPDVYGEGDLAALAKIEKAYTACQLELGEARAALAQKELAILAAVQALEIPGGATRLPSVTKSSKAIRGAVQRLKGAIT